MLIRLTFPNVPEAVIKKFSKEPNSKEWIFFPFLNWEILKAVCKPWYWNLGIWVGIGIETWIGTDIITTSLRPMAPKLSRVVAQDEGTTPTKWRGNVTNKRRYISTFVNSMDPKRHRVVTYDEGAPSTKSHDTYKVRWQMKKHISTFTMSLTPKLSQVIT